MDQPPNRLASETGGQPAWLKWGNIKLLLTFVAQRITQMPQRLRLVALTYFSLLLFLHLKAQTIPPDYSVTNYNSDNALPQNSINDMAFDPNGFLWLATEMGMVRFDGQHFREYNRANSPALYRDRCSLVKLVKGRIVMEPAFASQQLLAVTPDYRLQADSLLSAHPFQCNRWSNGIFYFDHIFKKWGGDTTNFKGLLRDLPANGDLVTENERQAYVRKDSGCYYLNDNTADVRPLTEIDGHAMKIQFMVGDLFFYVDRQNRCYAFKQGRWQKKITCSERLSEIFSQAQSGPYPSQYTVKAIRDTSHTFLVYKGNILLLHARNGVLDFEVLASNTSIRDISCMIYDDVYRVLYIGTATSGLYILRKFQFRQLAFTGDNYAINSLYAQVEISNGRILTASGVLDPNKTVNIPSPGLYDQPGLLRSSDGYIWYSNYNYLKRIDTGLHSPVTIQYLDGWLMAITETSNKDILCGTVNKLFRVRGKDFKLLLDKPAPELASLLIRFRKATLDLNEFAQDFLVWTTAQKEGFVVRQERIVLCGIVEDIVSLYEPAANINNNTVLNLVPASVTLVSDPDILKLIIRNLVDNANKYTMNGEIKMEAMQDSSAVRIIITDTGKSMEKDLVAKIFNNAYQSNDVGHGIGYRIIFELLVKINGKLAIDTPGHTGNRITPAFPTEGE